MSNIPYELAKRLKDAGFPLSPASIADGKADRLMFQYGKDSIGRDNTWWLEPSLSELIEECGDIILFKLPEDNTWDTVANGSWVAALSSKYGDATYLCAGDSFIDTHFSGEIGDLPEIAVANLWLALNSKTPGISASTDVVTDAIEEDQFHAAGGRKMLDD